jgi:hypothetical protein
VKYAPFISLDVNLIANTTESGFHVEAGIEVNPYPTGKKASDDELARVNLFQVDFHGEDWNYLLIRRRFLIAMHDCGSALRICGGVYSALDQRSRPDTHWASDWYDRA